MRSALFALLALVWAAALGWAAELPGYREVPLGPPPLWLIRSPNDLELWAQMRQQVGDQSITSLPGELMPLRRGPYGRRVAAVIPKGTRQCCVWLDGKEGPAFDQIRRIIRGAYNDHDFLFSPDGGRLAYSARVGQRWVMVVDGKVGKEYDSVGPPHFSADGKHLGYVAHRGKQACVVVDGQETGWYPAISPVLPVYGWERGARALADRDAPVVYSPDGRFAFVARKKAQGKREREVAVVGGKESPAYDIVRTVEFSPNGKRVAYVGRVGERSRVVVDGQPGPEFAEVTSSPVFSPDGRRLAYVASDGNRQFVVADGKKGAPYNEVDALSLVFSPDGKHLAYVATVGEKQCVVVDGKPGPRYDRVGDPYGTLTAPILYSPDGRLAYRAQRGEQHYVVIAGKESGPYEEIGYSHPLFSPDGKHVAFAAQKGERWRVVLDGVEGPEYPRVFGDTLVFSKDGRLAYAASRDDGTSVVVAAGQEGKPYAWTSQPVFNPDGKRLAYLAAQGPDRFLVLDGVEGPTYTDVSGSVPFFQKNGTLEFIALRDTVNEQGLHRMLYRVLAEP